ncbi:hypothetical protein GO986_17985 [Deinococcus sp. HMF7620]|uniref:Uncharacterized protein n=1 Tax=Deinococcus arboris TaxID=2682977 RepID=A0A7C9HTJ1_9DEIO|nr:hypothetical protein [Deinococcus arboris]MVN88629.1 hypothetical protein [Deinococcus arboris]
MPKSWTEYLEDHNNDATAAGEAAARDVASRERENGAARTFKRTFESVLQELDIPQTREGATLLMERLDAANDTSNRVPQGGLALTAEQRATWEQVQPLLRDGEQTLTPAQVWERLDQGVQATQREQLRTITDASGARLSVLQDRLRGTNLRVELRDRTENGQPVKDAQGNVIRDARVIETVSGQDTDRGVLREYAQANWGDYFTSLFPATTQTTGMVVTPQAGATGAGEGLSSYAAKVLADRQAAANPTPPGGTA